MRAKKGRPRKTEEQKARESAQKELQRRNLAHLRANHSRVAGHLYTQSEIADLAGVAIDNYRIYEGGKGLANLDDAMKLARVFGCAVEALYSGELPEAESRRGVFVRAKLVGPATDDEANTVRLFNDRAANAPRPFLGDARGRTPTTQGNGKSSTRVTPSRPRSTLR